MQRRQFIKGIASGAIASPLALKATTGEAAGVEVADLRGSLDASKFGVRPDVFDDQSRMLQRVLDQASSEDKPVFLPSGNYVISNIDLPVRTRLIGIRGASRLIYGGGGAMMTGNGCEILHMQGLVFDGANRAFGDTLSGLLHARACPNINIDQCDFVGSMEMGITLETCGGRFERSTISGAAGSAALYSVNATGLSVVNNHVSDCANGGILIHRWTVGADDTIVSGNRVERIAAKGGGTGQRGNGINLFRANGVNVSNNHISDCAFSAIRANSASNVLMSGNTCLRSGETALYAEFSFEGSIITNNIVDGAAIGVSIANFDEGGRLAVCSNNLIRNLVDSGPYPAEIAGFGIGISVEADTSVTGNVIENAERYGMMIGWGPYLRNVVASNNIVRKAGEGIAVSVVEDAGRAIISGNVIEGTRNGAIVGHRWSEATTGDLTKQKKVPFSHLTLEGNFVG